MYLVVNVINSQLIGDSFFYTTRPRLINDLYPKAAANNYFLIEKMQFELQRRR